MPEITRAEDSRVDKPWGYEIRWAVTGRSVHLPPHTRHRITAVENADIFEVSTPEIDDVVRLEDRYGRAGT